MQISITALGDIERAESITAIEHAAERAALARIEAHQAARRNATTDVERLAADLAALEAEQAETAAVRGRLAALCAREQEAIDVTLTPLQEQCYQLAQNHEFGDRADSVRKRRDRLGQQREAAGRPLRDFDRKREDSTRRLAERIRDCRETLEQARQQAAFDGTSTEALEKAAKAAQFKVRSARDLLQAARALRDQHREKLRAAHDAIDAEADEVHDLAELVGEREKLIGNAFIAGRPADPETLADLDKRIAQGEKHFEQTAAGARAAIATLEAKIGEQQNVEIPAATARLEAAELVLTGALQQFERRLTEEAEREHEGRMRAVRERVESFRVVEAESL